MSTATSRSDSELPRPADGTTAADGAVSAAPLAGIRVVEVALGVTAVGAGLAASLPGALLRDFGARVTRVRPRRRPALDTGVEFNRVWDHGKRIVEVDEGEPAAAETIAALARDADVILLAGPEETIELRGLGCADLGRANPRLVAVRVGTGFNAGGGTEGLEILLAARSGLLTQIRANRPGPAFADLTVASAGAGLAATVGALAGLYERESTGVGGWAETSLVDGLQAILPMIIGRVENPSPSTRLLWKEQGPAETLAYRCADGGYVQLWFGAKGAYEAFLEHMNEPPSEHGYTADLVSGAMAERGERWTRAFAARDRSWWLRDLAGANFRCEPVLRPGEALLDPHVREIGLSVERADPDHGTITTLGPVGQVTPWAAATPTPGTTPTPGARLLTGVRVLDVSAYLAGPIAPLILAELGADVIKLEPGTGDVHRSMEPMFAAGQRGKRAVAMDMKAPGAADVLDRLFRWSDVVHHNARVGLAERLGYDEATVRAANPGVVYSHSSGFGATGPRAPLPANDHLMQALSGVEAAQGGTDQPPTFLVWGAIDVTSGWVAACAVLAGLYARRRGGGTGQSVRTSLLGAALMLKSGAFVADGAVVEGPVLDHDQTGYGAAYRIYRCGDGGWLALAVPDTAAWRRLREAVAGGVATGGVATGEGAADVGLPQDPPPLRTRRGERQPAEELLEKVFRTGAAADWVARLQAAGVPAELVAEVDRTGFIARLVDDPVNQQLGRVVSFDWGERGRLDQPAFPLWLGPAARPGAPRAIPRLGEHTHEVLDALGFDADERAALVAAGAIPRPEAVPAG
ncbi:CaiB/BaiF CoA-transferase family protein [Parafrankia discariae]|uniref:CaiB/BaiF CoA-transferase family protein n=1 Tax=Parafrankia discariae TaxID=365528 RepID=UPI0003A8F09F|nr:CoA transferase [Parafrankia discariae]